MNTEKQVKILKKVLDKMLTSFDSEEDKINFILDICNGYKDELVKENNSLHVKLTLPVQEIKEHQLTDVVLKSNFPFMTLTESKLPNVWYHESFDWLCKLTPMGFKQEKLAFKGSKKILFEQGFER